MSVWECVGNSTTSSLFMRGGRVRGGREGGREGGSKRQKEGGREGGREGKRERQEGGRRENEREGRRGTEMEQLIEEDVILYC